MKNEAETSKKLYVMYSNPITKSHSSDEQWGEWWEHHGALDFHRILSEEARTKLAGRFYEDWDGIDVDFKPEVGNTYYVVYIIFSTGNSFGYSEGNMNVLGIYDTYKKADSILWSIQDALDKGVNYAECNGEKIYIGSYIGYFESVDYVGVEPLIFQE